MTNDCYARRAGRLLCVAVSLTTLATSHAVADAAEDTDTQVIEDIVVTAQKRAENLQEVPVAVSALSGDSLEQAYALDLKAISANVPNLIVTNVVNVSLTAAISIRGIGVQEADGFIDPAVGVVVDGVFQGSNTTALLDLFDIERIEVLRGPQGTLFGANTIGGVINVITKQPTGEFGGSGRLTVGNYGRFDVMGSVDFPITEQLSGKVTAMHKGYDGFYREKTTGKRTGGQNVTTGRAYLKYENDDDFHATLQFEYGRGRNDSPPVVNYATPDMALYSAEDSHVIGGPVSFVTTSQHYNFSDYDIYGTTLTMNFTLGEADIVSISNYREFKLDEWTDQDGSGDDLYNTRRITENWQASQELRAAFQPSDNSEFLIGGYYLFKNYKLDSTSYLDAFVPGLVGLLTNDQDDKSIAAFAQGSLNVTEKLRLQAGVRYGWQEKEMTVTTGNLLGALDLGGVDVTRSESWNLWGWRLGADYQVTDDVMAYAAYSRGSHSGGFNGRITVPNDIGPYNPEKVDSYEIGLKSDLMDKRLRLNAAVFYNDYSDIQVDQLVYENNNPSTRVLNAASAKIKGAELEMIAIPVDNLTINGSVSYLDAEYEGFFLDFDANPANGNEFDGSVLNLRNAPKWKTSLGLTYDVVMAGGGLRLNANWNYTSRRDTDTRNGVIGIIDPVHLVNGSVKYTSDQGWAVTLWGKNLFDERYITSGFFAPGVQNFASNGAPREVAVEVSFEF